MKSQVLLTVWCHISCEAAGEFWHWSLSGVKGLIPDYGLTRTRKKDKWRKAATENEVRSTTARLDCVIQCNHHRSRGIIMKAQPTTDFSRRAPLQMNKINHGADCSWIISLAHVVSFLMSYSDLNGKWSRNDTKELKYSNRGHGTKPRKSKLYNY